MFLQWANYRVFSSPFHQGEISGELMLVAAYQIFKELGLAKQQMQNTYSSLSVLPVSTGKLLDGGPEVASIPHLFTCAIPCSTCS